MMLTTVDENMKVEKSFENLIYCVIFCAFFRFSERLEAVLSAIF